MIALIDSTLRGKVTVTVCMLMCSIFITCDLLHFTLQVVGKKYVRLYSASLSDELLPHSETMLSNSSQVYASPLFLMVVH